MTPSGTGLDLRAFWAEDHRQRRLDVDDLDAGVVVGEQVDPSPPGLPQHVRGVEGRTTGPTADVPGIALGPTWITSPWSSVASTRVRLERRRARRPAGRGGLPPARRPCRLPGRPDIIVTVQRIVLVRDVMQIRALLPVEQEPGVIVGERVRPIEAAVLLGDQPPEVQVLLGTPHLGRRPASGVGEGEQVQQPVADEPGQRDDLVGRLRLFQEESRATVEADQPGDLLPCRQVAAQIPQDRPGQVLALHGVLRRGDPPGGRIDLRRERLPRVVEQGREEQDRLLVRREARPLVEQRELGADHLRVGPDIPFGMPPLILRAVGHRPSTRAGPRPRPGCRPAIDSRSSSHVMTRCPLPSSSRFAVIAWCCQCSLCLTFSTNSGRTNFARPVTMPPASVRRYSPSIR